VIESIATAYDSSYRQERAHRGGLVRLDATAGVDVSGYLVRASLRRWCFGWLRFTVIFFHVDAYGSPVKAGRQPGILIYYRPFHEGIGQVRNRTLKTGRTW
jgi:hypothetical protein